MKIVKAEAFTFPVKYVEPFRISIEKASKKEEILVRLTVKSGITGYGEASPAKYATGETIKTCMNALNKHFLPAIKNMRADDIRAMHAVLDKLLPDNTSSKAAIDMAVYDICAKSKNMPLYKYLGGTKCKLATDMTIGLKPPEEMAQSAKKFTKRGFKILKIKLGTSAANDIERIKLIREAVGNKIKIRVDANQGWKNYETAAKAILGMEKYGIELIEQPLPRKDIGGLKKLKKIINTPIIADESARSLADVKHLINENAVDGINIKLMKCGGIYKALEIARFCEKTNIPCMIGGMCETKIAVSASMHLACSNDIFKYADLDGDLLLDDKLVTCASLGLKNGWRVLKNHPGLGILEINEKMLYPVASHL